MDTKFIKPGELKELLDGGNDNFLVIDIREPNEFNDWNIRGSINLPVNNLLVKGEAEDLKKELFTLPKDKNIVTVCMRGINSQIASSLLSVEGYRAYYLKDGLKGWNKNFEKYEINFDYIFTVVQFIRTGKGCVSYLVYSDSSKEGVIFDASVLTDDYNEYIKDNGIKVRYVIDTHLHADHFSGGMMLAEQLGTEYLISYEKLNNRKFTSPKGISLNLENVEINLLDTPGHTDESISFLFNGRALICGDLLLLESPGRPDLARDKEQTIKGAERLYDTLHNVIMKLEKNVKILPAHITNTPLRPAVMTLEELLKQNDSIVLKSKQEFVKFLTDEIPETPPNYDSIKRYNLAGIPIPVDYAEDLEIGPNRCAARK